MLRECESGLGLERLAADIARQDQLGPGAIRHLNPLDQLHRMLLGLLNGHGDRRARNRHAAFKNEDLDELLAVVDNIRHADLTAGWRRGEFRKRGAVVHMKRDPDQVRHPSDPKMRILPFRRTILQANSPVLMPFHTTSNS